MSTSPLISERIQVTDPAEAIELYYRHGWTDGLPVVPPTEANVMVALEKAGLAPSDVLGVVPGRGRVVTAEKVAINAVMAGCLPEYMPVVAAAVRAICQDPFNLHSCALSTQGSCVLVVVNGPVRHQLGFNGGVNALGPGWRTNATVGRAIRLILMNVCGTIPGVLDKSTLGHPGKYSFCFAEDEESSPWEPLQVERGISSDHSAVTVFATLAPWQVTNVVGNTPEGMLIAIADIMRAAGPGQGEIISVLPPEVLLPIREAGWSKDQVRQFLFENAQRTAGDLARASRSEPLADPAKEKEKVPICLSPESITLIPAGGEAGAFAAIIPLWGSGIGSRSVIMEIDTDHI